MHEKSAKLAKGSEHVHVPGLNNFLSMVPQQLSWLDMVHQYVPKLWKSFPSLFLSSFFLVNTGKLSIA